MDRKSGNKRWAVGSSDRINFAALRCRLKLLVCCLLPTAYCLSAGAQPPRPLVVLFPAGQEAASGISGEKDASATLGNRILAATHALRDRLADSNALLVLMYSPESPVFVLAAQQANLNIKELKRRGELTPDEQAALGKAAGAVYVLAVSSPKVLTRADEKERDGEYELLIAGREIGGKGKEWTDKTSFFTSYKPKEGEKSSLTDKPFTEKDAQTSLNSAANTLAVHLLSGPLGDYGRPAATPNELPIAKPKPPVEEAPAVEIDQSSAALQQARAQLGDGDFDGAISTLRKAVNRSPLDMPLRLALAKVYLAADRRPEAAQEAKRALTLTAAGQSQSSREERIELSRLLADTMKTSGDATAAKEMYRQIIAAQPRAVWARVSLGDLLISTGEADAAEKEYRAALEIEAGSQDAAAGIARVHAAKGDYEAALSELTSGGKSGTPNARQKAVITIFNDAAPELARLMQTNREAWEGKRLSRETFYNATQSQSRRAATLLSLLRAAPPTEAAPEIVRKAHARRILAASLLAQAASSLLSYLDSGDAEAGAQSAVYLDDFQKEMTELRGK